MHGPRGPLGSSDVDMGYTAACYGRLDVDRDMGLVGTGMVRAGWWGRRHIEAERRPHQHETDPVFEG